MAINKGRSQTSGKKGTPQKFDINTCLFYENQCYQLRLQDGLSRTVDVMQITGHFKCSSVKIRVGSNNSKLNREMLDSMLAD
jgi:hypothetical protein